MNTISYEVKDEKIEEDVQDKKLTPQLVDKKALHIIINKKSIDEMRVFYNFNELQNWIVAIFVSEDKVIYTIEGNSTNDTCLEHHYSIDSKLIYGFETLNY